MRGETLTADVLRDAAARGLRVNALAREIGCSAAAVTKATRRHRVLLPGQAEQQEPAVAPARPEILPRPLPPHPFWTPERDALILKTAGHYEALSRVAGMIGKPLQACLARHHRLRASG